MRWIEIGTLYDIPARGARCIVTPIGRIAVFRTTGDVIYALEDKCPHKAGPLSQGIVHGAYVTCPLHNWVFSLETGEALGADDGRVRTFALKCEENRILLDVTNILLEAEAAG